MHVELCRMNYMDRNKFSTWLAGMICFEITSGLHLILHLRCLPSKQRPSVGYNVETFGDEESASCWDLFKNPLLQVEAYTVIAVADLRSQTHDKAKDLRSDHRLRSLPCSSQG